MSQNTQSLLLRGQNRSLYHSLAHFQIDGIVANRPFSSGSVDFTGLLFALLSLVSVDD